MAATTTTTKSSHLTPFLICVYRSVRYNVTFIQSKDFGCRHLSLCNLLCDTVAAAESEYPYDAVCVWYQNQQIDGIWSVKERSARESANVSVCACAFYSFHCISLSPNKHIEMKLSWIIIESQKSSSSSSLQSKRDDDKYWVIFYQSIVGIEYIFYGYTDTDTSGIEPLHTDNNNRFARWWLLLRIVCNRKPVAILFNPALWPHSSTLSTTRYPTQSPSPPLSITAPLTQTSRNRI